MSEMYESIIAAKDQRIRELEAEVALLTSRLNTTIRGANSGHLDGEARHE